MYRGEIICACDGGAHGAVGETQPNFVLNLVVLTKIMLQDVFQPHLISLLQANLLFFFLQILVYSR